MDPLQELAKEIKGISPLASGDDLYFREQFKRNPVCYANSWLYILRSTRNETGEIGHKFQDNEVSFGIGYRNHIFYLVGLNENISTVILMNLCKALSSVNNSRVVLKKVNANFCKTFLETKHFYPVTGSLTKDILEDEAFPEHIREDFTLRANAHELGKKVRRFSRSDKAFMQMQKSHQWSGDQIFLNLYYKLQMAIAKNILLI